MVPHVRQWLTRETWYLCLVRPEPRVLVFWRQLKLCASEVLPNHLPISADRQTDKLYPLGRLSLLHPRKSPWTWFRSPIAHRLRVVIYCMMSTLRLLMILVTSKQANLNKSFKCRICTYHGVMVSCAREIEHQHIVLHYLLFEIYFTHNAMLACFSLPHSWQVFASFSIVTRINNEEKAKRRPPNIHSVKRVFIGTYSLMHINNIPFRQT